MHIVEGVGQDIPSMQDNQRDEQYRTLVIDAIAVLQSPKTTPHLKILFDLEKAFVSRIEHMLMSFQEGRIVLDRYIDQSLKNNTRMKRSEFNVHSHIKLAMTLRELISSSKTTGKLTE